MELKPCPHCGGELDTNNDSKSCFGKFYLSCMVAECGYTGPIRKTLLEAIEAANIRTPDTVPRLVFNASVDAIAKKDEILNETFEALEEIVRLLSHGLQNSMASLTAKAILKKYNKQNVEQK